MKHSFRLKKSVISLIFENKIGLKNVSIENKTDVFDLINTILNFIELEDFLQPSNCSYNFVNNEISFQLELDVSKSKSDFFKSIIKFQNFIEI